MPDIRAKALKRLQLLVKLCRELEQWQMIRSGVWFCGPQAESFKARADKRIATLIKRCDKVLGYLERFPLPELAKWRSCYQLIKRRLPDWFGEAQVEEATAAEGHQQRPKVVRPGYFKRRHSK